MPSLWDTYGLVYLEAMSCGLPIIGIDSGGPSEIIKNEFGFKANPESIENLIELLSNYLITLIKNKDLRIKMGKAARLEIERNYTWQILSKQMLDIYEDIIS